MKMDRIAVSSPAPYSINEVYLSFPPQLRQQLKELIENGELGMARLTIDDMFPFRKLKDSEFSYHYLIKVPYAGKKLSWELIFEPDNLEFAPDFAFADDFISFPTVNIITKNVPSLLKWSITNENSLKDVLHELFNFYKKTQVDRLMSDNIYSNISTEYKKFMSRKIIEPKDVEILVENSSVHIQICLKVDLTYLPEYIQHRLESREFWNCGEDMATLRIQFLKLDGSRVNTTMHLSPRVDQVFGKCRSLHIPTYNNEHTNNLAEYVMLVSKLFKDLTEQINTNYRAKVEFVTTCCNESQLTVIEYDFENYSKINFFFKLNGYTFLGEIKLSESFPMENPQVTLQSIYCVVDDRSCNMTLRKYPYSPRWSSAEMLRRILDHLKENVPDLRAHEH